MYNKNIAIIFAGGTGQRMNSKTKPKQFLELHGKPLLVYTLETFNSHNEVDAIILVMLQEWIPFCKELAARYHIEKLVTIVPGGSDAQESIFNGLSAAGELFGSDSIVLIHDGVRPLIDSDTISKDIECVVKNGNAITVSPAIETITIKGEEGEIGQIIDRSACELARAPQCFYLKDILIASTTSMEDGLKFIDSASLMQHYGYKLYSVKGRPENIKITTPSDFYIFRAIIDAEENSQIFGL